MSPGTGVSCGSWWNKPSPHLNKHAGLKGKEKAFVSLVYRFYLCVKGEDKTIDFTEIT